MFQLNFYFPCLFYYLYSWSIAYELFLTLLHFFFSDTFFDKLSSKTTFEYDYFVVILKMTGTFELGFDNNTKSFPMNDYWVPLDV